MNTLEGASLAQVRLLGPLELCVGGELVALGGPKQRTVLALLALQLGPVSVSALLEAVWDGSPQDGAVRSLRTYVSTIRRLLGPGRS